MVFAAHKPIPGSNVPTSVVMTPGHGPAGISGGIQQQQPQGSPQPQDSPQTQPSSTSPTHIMSGHSQTDDPNVTIRSTAALQQANADDNSVSYAGKLFGQIEVSCDTDAYCLIFSLYDRGFTLFNLAQIHDAKDTLEIS